jgi:hypothetical protein
MVGLIVLASLPALRVEVAPDTSCPLGESLPGALREQELLTDDSAGLRLEVSGRPATRVVLWQADGQRVGERTLPISTDCRLIARTVALLVRSWLSAAPPPATAPRSPVDALDAGARRPPSVAKTARASSPTDAPSKATAPVGAEDTSAPPEATPPQAVSTPNASEPAADAGDLGETAPVATAPAVPAPSAPPAPPAEEARGVFTPPTPRTWTLSTLALAGTAIGNHPVGQGSLAVDWGLDEPWGGLMELGLDSVVSSDVPPGRVSASLYWLALAVRRAFLQRPTGTGLYVGLGVRAFLISAVASNFTADGQQTYVSFGFQGSAEWRQNLWRNLFVLARIGVLARYRAEVLEVAGAGALVLLPWSFLGHVGIGWRF